MRHLVALALLAVNIVLAAFLALKWIDQKSLQIRQINWVEPVPVMLPKDSMAIARTQLAAVDLSGLPVTTQRPLFFSSRKPPVPPPPPVVPPPPPAPPPPPPPDPLASFELYGLISLGGGKGGVIAKIAGTMRQVKFGEKFGEWSLKEVVGRDAIFVGESGTERKITMNYRSLQQLGAASVAPKKVPDGSPAAGNAAPPAPTSFDQQVLEHRARINKARANAGLKPIENW